MMYLTLPYQGTTPNSGAGISCAKVGPKTEMYKWKIFKIDFLQAGTNIFTVSF